MKYRKIKNTLIANYDWSTDIDEHHKEMILDVNEVVSNHYKTKLDIQAEKYHESLNEKNRQLMELTVFNDGLEKQRRLDEATINGLRKEIVDKEESWGKTVGNFYEEILFNKRVASNFNLMYQNLQHELNEVKSSREQLYKAIDKLQDEVISLKYQTPKV